MEPETPKRTEQSENNFSFQEVVRNENILNKDMQTVTVHLKNTEPATAGNYGAFFIASRPLEVMEIHAVWSVASSSGTLQVEKLTGTTTEGSGSTILKSAIGTAGTAKTVIMRKTTELQNTILNIGDRLALIDAGTLTNLSNLIVTVVLKPRGKGDYK
jgi:hypothetical protein